MRKHISTIIAGIIFLTGLSLLLYPTISNFWNSKHQTQAVADYSKQIEKMDDQEKEQALAAAEEYNQTLITNGGRFTPSEKEDTLYKSLLDANGTGMMGYITIPEIRCKLPIYHGVEDSVLQVGIGHIEGSSLPVGGRGTHCVLSGHRGLPSAKLFTDLDKLEKGDIFLLHIYDKVLTYEIDQISIVEPEDYGLLEIEDGKDLCTLLTCTPYGINTQRLLVRGHRIENRSGDDSRVTSDAAEVSSLTVAVCVAIPLLIITVAVTREGNTVVLTNTAKKPGKLDGEVNPPSKRTTGKTTDKTSDKLPQTGQLWWPVLVLLFAGAICLLAGRVLRDRKEEKNR